MDKPLIADAENGIDGVNYRVRDPIADDVIAKRGKANGGKRDLPADGKRDLPAAVFAQVAQARANAVATAAEWNGFANGLVRGYLVSEGIDAVENVGEIAASGQYTVKA